MKKIWAVARSEYGKWVMDPKNILLLAVVLVAKTLCIDTLAGKAARYGARLSILEPFVAIGNSAALLALLPAVFLMLMSDYPRVDQNMMFMVGRTGKRNWVWGQLLFAAMAVFSFLLAFFGITVLLSLEYTSFTFNWSESTRFYIAKFPEDMDSFAVHLLPPNLYNQIPLVQSLGYTLSLSGMYLYLLCCILMAFKMVGKRRWGLYGVILLLGAGTATFAMKTELMWWLPMANSVIWMHYTEILEEPIKSIIYSYVYFAVAILALIILTHCLLRRADLLLEPGENQ